MNISAGGVGKVGRVVLVQEDVEGGGYDRWGGGVGYRSKREGIFLLFVLLVDLLDLGPTQHAHTH